MEVIAMTERSNDRQLTEELLGELLAREPASTGDWRTGKVCQVCGEMATVASWPEWVAAHAEGGEFVGLGGEHRGCGAVPPGAFAERAFRYCEVCRGEVAHAPERRVDLTWICEPCEGTVRKSGHEIGRVFEELCRRRFDRYERDPAAPPAEIETRSWPQGERVPPPPGWLPPGLFVCQTCGTVRGETFAARSHGVGRWTSTCLCEGPLCKRCGILRVRKPISDHYNPADGRFWHVPHFTGLAPCRRCREEERALTALPTTTEPSGS
jgi:hypothetical protein